MEETTRICRQCRRALALSSYYRDKRGPGGYRSKCKECHKADVMARWWANLEANRARQARYRADPEHRRRDRESSARWRSENPERAKAKWAEIRARPGKRELANQLSRAWRIANPERCLEHKRRRNALKKKVRGGRRIAAELLAAKLAYWGHRCWIGGPNCLVVPDQWDHVKPLSKGGLHLLANLRPACNPCNSSKKASWPFPIARYGPERDKL